MKREIKSLVLAAGKGTRMESDLPKVLHKVAGKSMISMILNTLEEVEGIKENVLILGHEKEKIIAEVGVDAPHVVQEEQLGTGHAVKVCKDYMADFNGDTLILCGDTPLLRSKTLQDLVASHQEHNVVCTVLTAHLDNPTGYGRMVKNNGYVTAITEELDATPEEREIKEVNTGVYIVNNKMLFKALDNIKNNNVKQEYYLTDIVSYFASNGLKVNTHMTPDILEVQGINTKHQLEYVESIIKSRG